MKHAAFANCHMTDFIIDNHFELLPQYLKDVAASIVDENINIFSEQQTGLAEFMQHCASMHMDEILTGCPHLNLPPSVLHEKPGPSLPEKICVKDHMNDKKSHEVEELSHFVAKLAALYNCDYVLDVGSGRGF